MRKHFVTRICGTPYVCMNIILICAEVLLTCLNLLTTTAHWDRECLTVLFLNWGGSPLPHGESNKTAQEEKTMLERCASLLSSLSDVEPSDVAPVVATSPSLSSVRLSVAAVGGPESMAIESAGPVSVPIHPSPAGRPSFQDGLGVLGLRFSSSGGFPGTPQRSSRPVRVACTWC